MLEGVVKIGRILWPLLLGVFLSWAALFTSDRAFESSSIVNLVLAAVRLLFDPVYLEDLKIPLARMIIGFAGLSSFAYLVVRDYSELFPKRFAIDVHFDVRSLTHALGQFTTAEFDKLNIASQWKEKYIAYFASLNESLQAEGVPFQFDCTDKNATEGQGQGVFKVKKARYFGSMTVQSYSVVEASGTLKFYAADDRVSKKSPLTTQYSLVGECLVQASLKDLFLWRSILIQPIFEQSIPSPTTPPRHPTLVMAATKVTLWPFFAYETVYLIEDNDHSYIPVGYAHYTPLL